MVNAEHWSYFLHKVHRSSYPLHLVVDSFWCDIPHHNCWNYVFLAIRTSDNNGHDGAIEPEDYYADNGEAPSLRIFS
ncbi:hypothetical protein YC2023_052825 [Brassica napus]